MVLEMMDWSALRMGDEVELLDGAKAIARGTVDGLTGDREIVWLIPSFGSPGRPSINRSYGSGRRMFHRADGWGVRILGPWPEPL
ncbi:hypothetical protein AB0284_14455 [Pseudarthrobacter phenanthrenivorans]|uniref:hypothetical protein n=1 Tax=Pseudarthrobacter phenanthrenivorans TaxID=361575 RepID=UPI0034510FA9